MNISNPFRKNEEDEKSENNKSKENKMSEYQGNKSKLDYQKVDIALNKGKKPNANLDSLKSHIENFLKGFNELSKDEKQEELKSDNFKILSNNIVNLTSKDNKLRSIKEIMKSMENQKELSAYEILSQDIKDIQDTLIRLEEEDIKVQGKNLSDIATSTDKIDEMEKVLNNIKNGIPKTDFSSIERKISDLKKELENNKNDINNSNRDLAQKIDNIKPPKIPNDYLKKEDFEFTINDKLKGLKEIKESSENLETVPAKVNSIEKEIKSLSKKLDNLPFSNTSQPSKHIPKEEKSVVDLAKFMTDGVAQFENIAKEYISKINDLEKLEKIKEEHQEELEKIKKDEFENGKKVGKIDLIKRLAEDFPTEFKTIQSTFEAFFEEKFEKDEILEINDSNRNERIVFIDGNIDNGKYKVLSPAILIGGETLIKATLKKNIDGDEKEES